MRSLMIEVEGLKLREVQAPRPRAGMALLRSPLVGICRTDLAAAAGRIPRAAGIAFGHEFSARIAASARFEPGTLVAGTPFLDGAFRGLWAQGVCSEWIEAPEDSLLGFPEGFDPKIAALLEPICASLAPLKAIPAGCQRAAVVGSGRLARLAWMGLEERLPTDLMGVEEAAERVSQGERYGFVVETCAGRPGALEVLLGLLAHGGTLCVKSRSIGMANIDMSGLLEREACIATALYGDWKDARRFAVENASRLEAFCGEAHALAEWELAIERAQGGEEQKIYIQA